LGTNKSLHKVQRKYSHVVEERGVLLDKIKEYEPKFKSPYKRKKSRRRHTVQTDLIQDFE
jgi:hypothetical protein